MAWFFYGLPDFLFFRGFSITPIKGRLIWIAIYPFYVLLAVILYPIHLTVLFTQWLRTKYFYFPLYIRERRNKR